MIITRACKERVTESVTEGVGLPMPEMKPEQLKVAATFIEGRDVFSVWPTGFGKSLCSACLPLAFDKLARQFFSHRLVSIIEDQVNRYWHNSLHSPSMHA